MKTPLAFQEANASFVTDRLLVGGDLDQYDGDRAMRQLIELVVDGGVTHIVDCRFEADDTELYAEVRDVDYLHHGIDDAGQHVAGEWFERGVQFALDALRHPESKVFTHCHMGINRGPSLGFAVLLGVGWDPVEALAAIRSARPIANIWYAEDALAWHFDRTSAGAAERRATRARVARWREENPLDVVRVIRRIRAQEAS